MTTEGWEEKASPTISYSGARFLQCPHHGAKNSTNAALDPSITWSKLLGVRSITEHEAR